MTEFETELSRLINKYSKENNSNTPDFILAQYLSDLSGCLVAYEVATQRCEQWRGREKVDGSST